MCLNKIVLRWTKRAANTLFVILYCGFLWCSARQTGSSTNVPGEHTASNFRAEIKKQTIYSCETLVPTYQTTKQL